MIEAKLIFILLVAHASGHGVLYDGGSCVRVHGQGRLTPRPMGFKTSPVYNPQPVYQPYDVPDQPEPEIQPLQEPQTPVYNPQEPIKEPIAEPIQELSNPNSSSPLPIALPVQPMYSPLAVSSTPEPTTVAPKIPSQWLHSPFPPQPTKPFLPFLRHIPTESSPVTEAINEPEAIPELSRSKPLQIPLPVQQASPSSYLAYQLPEQHLAGETQPPRKPPQLTLRLSTPPSPMYSRLAVSSTPETTTIAPEIPSPWSFSPILPQPAMSLLPSVRPIPTESSPDIESFKGQGVFPEPSSPEPIALLVQSEPISEPTAEPILEPVPEPLLELSKPVNKPLPVGLPVQQALPSSNINYPSPTPLSNQRPSVEESVSIYDSYWGEDSIQPNETPIPQQTLLGIRPSYSTVYHTVAPLKQEIMPVTRPPFQAVQLTEAPTHQQHLTASLATIECPYRDGLFSIHGGDCSQYLMCHDGKATIMHCPFGLVFNETISSCDWLENVPLCRLLAFKSFKCPVPSPYEQDFITKHRYGNECGMYVACLRGYPRLLQCDLGLSFDEYSHDCIDTDRVQKCRPNNEI